MASSNKRLTKEKEKKTEGMEKRTHGRYGILDKPLSPEGDGIA
jgi:hypothetical protein